MATKYYTYPVSYDEPGKKPFLTNDTRALVSVIVPIYNAGPYLDQAISSIRNQTHKKLEIILLNDGSTDNSLDIIKKHAAQDDRIVVIDKENQGYGATCNRGLDEAHGEWIAIMEPDDWIELGMYKDMLEFASQFLQPIEIIKTPYWRIVRPDTPQQQKLHCSYKHEINMPTHRQPFTIEECLPIFHHHPSIWSAIYRKSFLDKYKIRFQPIPGAGWADNPFLAETLLQAKTICYLDKAYYCYREDTKEKTAAFHQNNPAIPFDRWNDIMDVMERLNITNQAIICAHYSRGFMYMSGVIEEHGTDDPEIDAKLHRMFDRMDPQLVFNYPFISPGCRRLFAEYRGLPNPDIDKVEYAANLAKKGALNVRNAGIRSTLEAIVLYFKSYKKRSGGR